MSGKTFENMKGLPTKTTQHAMGLVGFTLNYQNIDNPKQKKTYTCLK